MGELPILITIISIRYLCFVQGVAFAFKASLESIGSLLSPLLLNSIYRMTVQTKPNFVFIMHGTLSFIPLILTV